MATIRYARAPMPALEAFAAGPMDAVPPFSTVETETFTVTWGDIDRAAHECMSDPRIYDMVRGRGEVVWLVWLPLEAIAMQGGLRDELIGSDRWFDPFDTDRMRDRIPEITFSAPPYHLCGIRSGEMLRDGGFLHWRLGLPDRRKDVAFERWWWSKGPGAEQLPENALIETLMGALTGDPK